MKPQTYIMAIVWLAVAVTLVTPFVNAQSSLGVFKQNDQVQLVQTCSICSYITLDSIKYPDGTISAIETNMTKVGSTFYYNFTQTSQLGEYIYNTYYGNWTAPVSFEITTSGRQTSGFGVTANIALFVFFVLLIFTFYIITKNINFEKWHNSILQKYEHRNLIKVIISSIGYNIMKNKFVWYYLFGLPIILIITDMAYTFGVGSMIELTQIVLAVYWYGFLLVGIFFFGYLQEWIMQIADEIKSMDFGV
jgi:hypothetical protein